MQQGDEWVNKHDLSSLRTLGSGTMPRSVTHRLCTCLYIDNYTFAECNGHEVD